MFAVGVPIVLGPLMMLQRRVRATATQSRIAAAVLSTRLDESFHGMRTLQLTGSEPKEVERYRKAQNKFLGAQIRSQTASTAIPALIDFVAALWFAGVMLFGGMQILAGEKTLGEFMSFFTAMALVFEPLRRLGSVSAQWAQARASLERMRLLLDVAPTLLNPANPKPLPNAGAGLRLELRNVGFAYSELPVLVDASLIAEAGQTTALVGPSGAGKTTVFHLLSRMADPQSGQVLLGGTDIRDLDLSPLEIATVRHGAVHLKVSPALSFEPTLDESKQLLCVDDAFAGFDVCVFAPTREALLGELQEHLAMLWQEYALAGDDDLDPIALQLKKALLARMSETAPS